MSTACEEGCSGGSATFDEITSANWQTFQSSALLSTQSIRSPEKHRYSTKLSRKSVLAPLGRLEEFSGELVSCGAFPIAKPADRECICGDVEELRLSAPAAALNIVSSFGGTSLRREGGKYKAR